MISRTGSADGRPLHHGDLRLGGPWCRFTYPVFSATGEWTAALWFWALPAGVVLLLFLPLAIRQRHSRPQTSHGGVNVWRSAVAWQVTIFMVLQAMMSFSVFAWLAPILRERGVDGGTAG